MSKEVNNFEELVALLRNWRSWSGEEHYDFIGMVSLLGACLDSLREFALEAELEEIGEFLEVEQVEFLKKLAEK